MIKKIKKHLQENKMTYLEHLKFAAFYSAACFAASCFLIIHAILPCFFQTSGSDLVKMLALVFKKRD